jgi:hypothetical protein
LERSVNGEHLCRIKKAVSQFASLLARNATLRSQICPDICIIKKVARAGIAWNSRDWESQTCQQSPDSHFHVISPPTASPHLCVIKNDWFENLGIYQKPPLQAAPILQRQFQF